VSYFVAISLNVKPLFETDSGAERGGAVQVPRRERLVRAAHVLARAGALRRGGAGAEAQV